MGRSAVAHGLPRLPIAICGADGDFVSKRRELNGARVVNHRLTVISRRRPSNAFALVVDTVAVDTVEDVDDRLRVAEGAILLLQQEHVDRFGDAVAFGLADGLEHGAEARKRAVEVGVIRDNAELGVGRTLRREHEGCNQEAHGGSEVDASTRILHEAAHPDLAPFRGGKPPS